MNDFDFQKITHNMKLHPSPFKMIKDGDKTFELRLLDEKRKKTKKGDIIIFTNTESGETITASVLALHAFNNFEELYNSLPLLKCGYSILDIDTAKPSDMEAYYSKDEQKQYGVVGIEIAVK